MSCCNLKLGDYFRKCLYFTSGKLFRKVDRLACATFCEVDLAPTQAFILMALAEHDGNSLTPSELATLLELDRSTVTRLMNGLEAKKLIKRCKVGTKCETSITAKGLKLLPEIAQRWKKLYQIYSDLWGAEDTGAINKKIHDFLVKNEN